MILGVSPDDVAAQAAFKRKFDLPFTLLADAGHQVAEQYGVWRQKMNFGKPYMGVVRTTFLIGADGRITRVFENVNATGHAADVAAALDEEAAAGR